ncbi:MAG: hypothetical protein R3Y47_10920 [Lachnospiraceae bacterium]
MRLEVIKQIIYLRPALLVTMGITVAMYCFFIFYMRGIKTSGKRLKVVGLFMGLEGKSALMLSMSWTRFAYTIAILLLADPIKPVHYLVYFALLVLLFFKPRSKFILTTLVGGTFMTAGFFMAGILLDYLGQVYHEPGIAVVYWLLSVFLILCAFVSFFEELIIISAERSHFDETGELY